MIGAGRITEKIISDAENDARAKLAAAGSDSEKLRKQYSRRAAELRESMLAKAEEDAEMFVSRAKSTAAVEKRNAILNAKSEMVDAAFDTALAEIRAMEPEKYRSLTVRMYGFSEYFVTLSPVQQIGVLNRTVY